MECFDKNIIIETSSIDIAVFIFSILSLFCSIITILIYLRVKSLRTIIYRLFFQIAINETISRVAHIFYFFIKIIMPTNFFTFLFHPCVLLIYFTDTNILIFLTISCYSMYEIIIKQNKTLNNKLNIYLIVSYIFSFILTITFFILPLFSSKGENVMNGELYRNVITLSFIKDSDKDYMLWYTLALTFGIYSILVVFASYKVIGIHMFIRKRRNSNEIEEDANSEDKKLFNKFKLKAFNNKMVQYPALGLFFFIPIATYSLIEYFKDTKKNNLSHLRRRFYAYNINCFINSIRGWMYFRVFISNEKIKLYLFKNFLTSSIFDSIDKIIDIRKRRSSIYSNSSEQSDNSTKKKENENTILDDNDDEEQLMEFNNREASFDQSNNINKLYEDDDEEDDNKNSSKDNKSEIYSKRKKNYLNNKKIIN